MSYCTFARAAFALVAFAPVYSMAVTPWSEDWDTAGQLNVGPGAQSARFAVGPAGHMLVANADARMALFDTNGEQRWTITAAGTPLLDRLPPAFGDAVVDADGSAWYSAASRTDAYRDGDAVLTRVDASGSVLWSRAVAGVQLVRTTGGVVVAGCARSGLATVATQYDGDGRLVWQRTLPAAECTRVRLAAANGVVYAVQYPAPSAAPGPFTLSRLDGDGHIAQSVQRSLPTSTVPSLFASGTRLYLTSGPHTIHALDPLTLAERWNVSGCIARDIVPADAPVGAGDMICTQAGRVVRIDAETCAVRWSMPTDSTLRAVRAYADGVLLADLTSLRRLALTDGSQSWNALLPNVEVMIGIGHAANGRVSVARSSCIASGIGCLALVANVTLADGSQQRESPVLDVTMDVAGRAVRDGDRIYVLADILGGPADAVYVSTHSTVDGFMRWRSGLSMPYGAHLKGSRFALGPDYVAVAALWSMVPQDDLSFTQSGLEVGVFGRDGAFRWSKRFDLVDQCCARAPEIAVDAAGDIVVGTGAYARGAGGSSELRGTLRRLIVATGEERWRVDSASAPRLYRTGSDVIAVVDAGNGGAASVTRIATADGSVVWSRPLTTTSIPGLTVLADGDLAVLDALSPQQPAVSRLDYATGTVEWRRALGNGVTIFNLWNLLQLPNNELLLGGYSYSPTPMRANRPLLSRYGLASGNYLGGSWLTADARASVIYQSVHASADGHLWVDERRTFDNELVPQGRWLTELDANGAVLGSQSLGLLPFGESQRRTAWTFDAAPEGGQLIVQGAVSGGGKGQGHALALIDTAATETGDLAVTLDPIPALRTGREVAYAATVQYTGSAATTATLYLQVPWPGAGVPPACVAPTGDCTVDATGTAFAVSMRLNPGDVARVAGTLVAREAGGAHTGMMLTSDEQPLFMAAVAGRTGLRETALDNNYATQRPAMSLFADGFD